MSTGCPYPKQERGRTLVSVYKKSLWKTSA